MSTLKDIKKGPISLSQKSLPLNSAAPQDEILNEQSVEGAHETIADTQSEEEVNNYETIPLSEPGEIDSTATSRQEMELPFLQRKLELHREANQKSHLREQHLQELVAQRDRATEAETSKVLEQSKVRKENLVARLQRNLIRDL